MIYRAKIVKHGGSYFVKLPIIFIKNHNDIKGTVKLENCKVNIELYGKPKVLIKEGDKK